MAQLDKTRKAPSLVPAEGAATIMSDSPYPLAEVLPLPVFVLDEDGAVLFVNSAWRELTGLTLAQAKRADAADILHQDDLPRYREQWEEAKRRNQGFEIECRTRIKDGVYRWFSGTIMPVRSERDAILWIGYLMDVQQRHDVEAQLSESEQRFRHMADTAPALIWTSDADRQRTYFNRRWLEFTGRSVAQELEGGWASSVHPHDLHHLQKVYAGAFATREQYQVEYRLRRADGRFRWVLEVGVPRFTAENVFAGYIGSCIDIHDRKRAEEELRRSRDQLEAIFQGVGDGIVVRTTDGRAIFANEAAAQILGMSSAEEMIAHGLMDLGKHFEIVDENGLPLDHAKFPGTLALQGFKTGDTIVCLRPKHAAEREIWLVLRATPVFNEEGHVQFAVVILRDITHLKSAQRSFQFLSEIAIELNRSLDYKDTLTQLSRGCVPFLADCSIVHILDDGKLSLEAASCKHGGAVSACEAGCGELALPPGVAERVVASGKSEMLCDGGAPGTRRCSVLAVPLSARDRVLGCLALFREDAQREYTRSDLLLAEEVAHRAGLAIDNALLFQQSQQALSIRDDFLSIASHELKTPVTSVKAFLQAIERRMEHPDKFDFEKNREYMDMSIKQVDRLTAIINDLLDINRINKGRIQYQFKVLPIGPVIAEVVERMSASFVKHRLALKLQNLSAKAMIDELRFEQVLTNLITNAVKYSPEGSDIDITMRADGKRITIDITDHGVGISADEQQHIFDPYYRTAEAIKSKVTGMGVGLFISDQIIKGHNGQMRVRSELGKGSTFIIELPQVEVQ